MQYIAIEDAVSRDGLRFVAVAARSPLLIRHRDHKMQHYFKLPME